jgi:hypothetical protein
VTIRAPTSKFSNLPPCAPHQPEKIPRLGENSSGDDGRWLFCLIRVWGIPDMICTSCSNRSAGSHRLYIERVTLATTWYGPLQVVDNFKLDPPPRRHG